MILDPLKFDLILAETISQKYRYSNSKGKSEKLGVLILMGYGLARSPLFFLWVTLWVTNEGKMQRDINKNR